MTLPGQDRTVGIRELHDRLSEHLERVERGVDYVITRRGKPVARLSGVHGDEALDSLIERGLVRPPVAARGRQEPRVVAEIGDLIAEQRR